MKFNEENCYKYGKEIAKIHLSSNNFKSSHTRNNIDQTFLIDLSIKRLNSFFGNTRKKDITYLKYISNKLKQKIEKFSQTVKRDEWGIIGGDFHGHNHLCKLNGEITLFDFDLCGYGWRAYDLSVFKWSLFDICSRDSKIKNCSSLWQAFLKGYESHRALSKHELQIISTFVQTRQLWFMGSCTTYPDLNLDEKFWEGMFYNLRFLENAVLQ